MYCNSFCGMCPNPCYRGEIRNRGNKENISPISKEEEIKASEVFDKPLETGLAVMEDIGSYEVRKNIFGKEKTVRVK